MIVVELDGEGPLPRVNSHSKSKPRSKNYHRGVECHVCRHDKECSGVRTVLSSKAEREEPFEGGKGSREVELGAVALLQSGISD